MTDTQQADFDALLEYLKRVRGFDFNAYKQPSLRRRIDRRMQTVSIARYADYLDYLEVHPDEFGQLFNTILINVTAFFRDEHAWAFLRDDVVPGLLRAHTGAVRVWSAGCSSGEETYSLAMVLCEALGREQFRERVKIYATDVDDQALNQARAATYDARQVEAVPPALAERYFAQDGQRFVFDKDLRRSVIFGRHDLVQDAPISHVTLLACRNTLMYFNTEAQSRILSRFHFALGESGVLFLGKAEMLLSHSQLFAPIDLRHRIFRRVAGDARRERPAAAGRLEGRGRFDPDTLRVFPAVFDTIPHAQFIIDGDGRLALCNERGRALFNLGVSDLGRPVQDLELSYRPIELRSLMDQVIEQRRPTIVRDVRWDGTARDPRYFDIHVAPLVEAGNALGVAVSFVDVSRQLDLQQQLNRAKQDLETAYEELQSTNEELETTNEELQSTVEELETTNEELQSTNEELETVNGELMSANEGLQAINRQQLEQREALDRVNGFMQSVLAGVRNAVIVLDHELRVLEWNEGAANLWGLRSQEAVDQNFLNLDIGLPTERVRAAVRSCLQGDRNVGEIVASATNRRGRAINCRVVATPLLSASNEVCGAILVMEEMEPVQ